MTRSLDERRRRAPTTSASTERRPVAERRRRRRAPSTRPTAAEQRRRRHDSTSRLAAERDEYLKDIALRAAGRVRELPQAGADASGRRGRPGRRARLVERAAAGARRVRRRHRPRRAERRADLRRAARRPREGGPRARSTPTASRSTRTLHEAVLHEPRRRRRARSSAEILRTGYRWKGRVLRPAMVKVQGLTAPWPHSASGSRRTTTRSSACPRRPRRRRSPRRTASWPASTTPTPTPATPRPRSASRRSPPPTTSSATRTSARSTTRSAAGPDGRRPFGGGPGGPGSGSFTLQLRRRRPRRPARQPVRPRRPRRRRRGRPRRRARSAAPTSRPSCTCRSPTPSTASPPRSTSRRDAACSTCHGIGRQARHRAAACARTCGGRGVLDDNQGFFSFSHAVPHVRAARASIIDDPCPTCRGTRRRAPAPRGQGAHPRRRRRRPAHPAEGPRRPGRNGGPPGDLYVACSVEPHPLFGRDGDDLTLTVPITFAEAALGAEITVPTLDGGRSRIQLPPGTQPGRKLPGEGPRRRQPRSAPATCSSPSRSRCRRSLTDAERAAVEALARRRRRRRPATYLEEATSDGRSPQPRRLRHLGRRRAGRRASRRRCASTSARACVDPARTAGGSRRYSDADIERLRRIAELTDEGLNLAGVKRVLELEAELDRLQAELDAHPARRRRARGRAPTAATAATSCR